MRERWPCKPDMELSADASDLNPVSFPARDNSGCEGSCGQAARASHRARHERELHAL